MGQKIYKTKAKPSQRQKERCPHHHTHPNGEGRMLAAPCADPTSLSEDQHGHPESQMDAGSVSITSEERGSSQLIVIVIALQNLIVLLITLLFSSSL